MKSIKAPRKILLVLTRFLGDCLLATGMIRSLRDAYPQAIIDVMVTPAGRWALEGNLDIDQVIVVNQKVTLLEGFKLFRRYYRQYDLAITDKPTGKSEFYTLLFSKQRRFRVIEERMKGTWRASKRLFEHCVLENENQEHRVLRNLNLLSPLGISLKGCVVAPIDDALPELPLEYIVMHVPASNQLKQWPIEHWAKLLQRIIDKGVNVVLTGSPSDRDKHLLADLCSLVDTSEHIINLSGMLTVAQTSGLISKSRGYIGLDSGISHLASAHNIPIVVLITVDPASMWAPWPYMHQIRSGELSPFNNLDTEQTVGNVTLLLSSKSCSPCSIRHCVDDDTSLSPCLKDITPLDVFEVVARKILLYRG
ncbi:glycosyltransferase family 9 protein [Vibrio sp. M250220]